MEVGMVARDQGFLLGVGPALELAFAGLGGGAGGKVGAETAGKGGGRTMEWLRELEGSR